MPLGQLTPRGTLEGTAVLRFKEVGKRVMKSSSSVEVFNADRLGPKTLGPLGLAGLQPTGWGLAVTTSGREVNSSSMSSADGRNLDAASRASTAEMSSQQQFQTETLAEELATIFLVMGRDLAQGGARDAACHLLRHGAKAQTSNAALSSEILSCLLDNGGKVLAPDFPLGNSRRVLERLLTAKGAESERGAIERASYSRALSELEGNLVMAEERGRSFQTTAKHELDDSNAMLVSSRRLLQESTSRLLCSRSRPLMACSNDLR